MAVMHRLRVVYLRMVVRKRMAVDESNPRVGLSKQNRLRDMISFLSVVRSTR